MRAPARELAQSRLVLEAGFATLRDVEGRTHEGKTFRVLWLIDEFTREALAIRVQAQAQRLLREVGFANLRRNSKLRDEPPNLEVFSAPLKRMPTPQRKARAMAACASSEGRAPG